MGRFRSRHRRAVICAISIAAAFIVIERQLGAAPQDPADPQLAGISTLDQADCLANGDVHAARDRRTGSMRFVGTEPGRPIPNRRLRNRGGPPETAARTYLAACGHLFGVRDAANELRTVRIQRPTTRRSVLRFQQMHRGLPVLGGELVVHVDAGGDVVTVGGRTFQDLDVDTTVTVSAATAAQTALDVVARNYSVARASLVASTPEGWLYNPELFGEAGAAVAVWRIEVTPRTLEPIRELVLVDQQRGSVVLHFNQVDTALNRQTYTANNATILPGALVCNESDASCSAGDAHASAAHLNAADTYNFYLNTLGRDGINDAGMPMVSTVHYGIGYSNAFWNGSQMVYGDAAGFPLADDVVGHELTHGVTQYTSNLFNYYQSGAISESLSDIFGEFVDQTNGRGNDDASVKWLLGEDVAGLGAARSMVDPPAYGEPDRISSPYYYLGSSDNGGVHTNNGVGNKAAYLMVAGGTFNGQGVATLGLTKVAKIYYEAQTHLLTSGSDYADLYDALYQACNNLVGTNSITTGDCLSVRAATDAVEMNRQPATNFNREAPICQNLMPPSHVFLDTLENGTGNWLFGAFAGSFRWRLDSTLGAFAHSGQHFLWADDFPAAVGDSYARMRTGVTIPQNAFLHFAHAFSFDAPSFDGGVVEFSTNNGSSWADAGPLFDWNGYPGAIASSSNPLNGRSAFIGNSHGYMSSRLNLSSLAGQTALFRWRMGTDFIVFDRGWYLDDVRIYTCVPAASLTVSLETVAPGDTVPVVVDNAPGNTTDWVGLYLKTAADSDSVDWSYLNGLKTPPETPLTTATLNFAAPVADGIFEYRLFMKGSSDRNATSNRFNVTTGPIVTINDVAVVEGNSGTTPATFTVTLSKPNPTQDVTVHYVTAATTSADQNDFVGTSGDVIFPAGTTTQTIPITINGDTTSELDETFFVMLSRATNALIADDQGVGTIINDDAYIAPTVTMTTPVVDQDHMIIVNVTNGPGNPLDWAGLYPVGAPDSPIALNWQYLNGGQTPPATGYTSATLAFSPPSTPGTYEVRLFASNGLTKLATSGPVVVRHLSTLSINDVQVSEGNSGTTPAIFTVTLTPADPTQTVTVNYTTLDGTATAGTDYVATSGTLTFPPGSTTQTISVAINGDRTFEPSEIFSISLSNAVNAAYGDATGAGGIVNDDPSSPPTLVPDQTLVRRGWAVSVAVTHEFPEPGDWVGFYSSSAPDATFIDWLYLNGSKTRPGESFPNATLVFSTTNDMPDGMYNFRLFSNDTFNRLGISPDIHVQPSPSTLSINDVSVIEGNSGTATAVFTVTLAPVDTLSSVTVHYQTANATATAGSDYQSAGGVVSFAPGEATKTVSVPVDGDTTPETDETFTITLSNAQFANIGDGVGVGTIVSDDTPAPAVTINTPTVNTGGQIGFTVANGPANSTDWLALYATGTPDMPAPSNWMYLNGQKTPPGTGLSGATLQVAAPQTPGTYEVRWFSSNSYTKLATSGAVTVQTQPTLTINDITVTEGNSGTTTANFTVTLSPVNPTQAATVNYATADGTATAANSDYVSASGTLTFNQSVATQTISVTVNGDTTSESNETFTVNLSGAVGAVIGDGVGLGTITNDDAAAGPTVTINTPTVNPGGQINFTVTNGPANTTDWVALYPLGAADIPAPSNWMYLNGQKAPPTSGVSNATLQVTAPPTPGTYEVRLFSANSYTKVATSGSANVQRQTTLTINDVSVTEGNSGTTTATFTVTLDPVNAAQVVTVNYTTADGTAAAGSDYTAANGMLTFNPSVATQTVSVVVNGDTTLEPYENFAVNLSNATNAVIGDGQGLATIANDDAAPAPSVSMIYSGVSVNQDIEFRIANGPANAKDWVGLFAAGAADTAYLDWMYLNGAKSAPATGQSSAVLAFPGRAIPGIYEVRLFANDAFTRIATSDAVSVILYHRLTMNSISVREGDAGTAMATFTVSLTPANTDNTVTVDYLTQHHDPTIGDDDYTAASGTLTFAPGVSKQSINVVIKGDTDFEPDEAFLVYLASPTHAVLQDTFAYGTIVNDDPPLSPAFMIRVANVDNGQVTVIVMNQAATATDWIGLYRVDAPDTAYLDWRYLNGQKVPPTTAVSIGTVSLTPPGGPGNNYELRLFSDNGFTQLETISPVNIQP